MPNNRFFQINFSCGCNRVEQAAGRCANPMNNDKQDIGCYTPICAVHQKPSPYIGLEYDGDPSGMPDYKLDLSVFAKYELRSSHAV